MKVLFKVTFLLIILMVMACGTGAATTINHARKHGLSWTETTIINGETTTTTHTILTDMSGLIFMTWITVMLILNYLEAKRKEEPDQLIV